MVYFKVNTTLFDIICTARAKVGCTKYCDRQITSLADLKTALQSIKAEIAELSKKLEAHEKAKEAEKKKNSKEPLSSVNAELMSMIISAKSSDILQDDELQEIDERLSVIEKFKLTSAEAECKKSEIVFT